MYRQIQKTHEKTRWIFSHRHAVCDRLRPETILQNGEGKKETEIL